MESRKRYKTGIVFEEESFPRAYYHGQDTEEEAAIPWIAQSFKRRLIERVVLPTLFTVL